MEKLKEAYYEFMNWYDPYSDEVLLKRESIMDMIYNLREIKKDVSKYLEDEFCKETFDYINDLQAQFKAAGYNA